LLNKQDDGNNNQDGDDGDNGDDNCVEVKSKYVNND